MLEAYAAYEAQVGVLPLPDGYDSVAQVSINSLAKQGNYLRNLMPAVIAAFLLLLIVLVRLIWRFVRR